MSHGRDLDTMKEYGDDLIESQPDLRHVVESIIGMWYNIDKVLLSPGSHLSWESLELILEVLEFEFWFGKVTMWF